MTHISLTMARASIEATQSLLRTAGAMACKVTPELLEATIANQARVGDLLASIETHRACIPRSSISLYEQAIEVEIQHQGMCSTLQRARSGQIKRSPEQIERMAWRVEVANALVATMRSIAEMEDLT